MKFCYQCGRASAGDPVFCSKCGRSYDVRLCPRLHRNSRFAKVCSQCGSRELSQAQPPVSFWWKVLEFLAKVVFGVLLVYLTLAGFVGLLQTPQFRNALIAFAILVGILWWLWSLLPEWVRKLVRRSHKRKERSDERYSCTGFPQAVDIREQNCCVLRMISGKLEPFCKVKSCTPC